MKTLSKLFFMATLFCLALNVTAQDAAAEATETIYYIFDYMKVEPGNHQDYLKMEAAWKKIHAVKKADGRIDNWTLMEIISPSGTSAEYNYVTRIRIKGNKQLAAFYSGDYFPENWSALLTEEEKELVKKTSELRTMVKSETFARMESILGPDIADAKVVSFNFFDFPEGKGRGDHLRIERDIWMPVHQARVDDGVLKGWVMGRMEMPGGSGQPYHDFTVDIYENLEQLLNDDTRPYFKKIHEGKDAKELWKETYENTDLVKREIRREVNSL